MSYIAHPVAQRDDVAHSVRRFQSNKSWAINTNQFMLGAPFTAKNVPPVWVCQFGKQGGARTNILCCLHNYDCDLALIL